MKRIAKLLALVMAIVMVLSLGTTAFASTVTDPTDPPIEIGSLTVNNTLTQHEYAIYKILSLESYDPDNKLYSYTIDTSSAWYDFVSTGAGAPYFKLTAKSEEADNTVFYAEWKDNNMSPATLASLAITYAKENSITPDAQQSSVLNTTIVFEDLPLGYYLVDSSQGALCSLTTMQPNATVNEKNDPHILIKEVKAPADQTYGETSNGYIGEVHDFKITVTVGDGAENLVIHDIMSAGLTFYPDSLRVYTNGTLIPAVNSQGAANWTLKQDVAHDGKVCTFEVEFANTYARTLKTDDVVTVTYNAEINEDAVVRGAGNPNDSYLSYGDDHFSATSQTVTYTWSLGVFKYTNADPTDATKKTPLIGAEFQLRANQNSAPVPLVLDGTTERVVDGETVTGIPIYRIAMADVDADAEKVTTISTGETGHFVIRGLDIGTFSLTETKAPEGYNKLVDPIVLVVTEDGTVTRNGAEMTGHYVEVANHAGALLPETGGMGTTLFYILGAVLMLGAVVLLVTKKRMSV